MVMVTMFVDQLSSTACINLQSLNVFLNVLTHPYCNNSQHGFPLSSVPYMYTPNVQRIHELLFALLIENLPRLVHTCKNNSGMLNQCARLVVKIIM